MNTQQTKTKMTLGVLALAGVVLYSMTTCGGDLEPPASPAPTMKTLDEIEPRTPVQSLPGNSNSLYLINQSGAYYLTGNITGQAGKNGITITSDDVTLDLCGFTLLGVPGSLSGIFTPSRQVNVVVRNGVIRGWGNTGCDMKEADNSVMKDLLVSNNTFYGLSVGDHCLVINCAALANNAIGIYSEAFSVISGCTSNNNDQSGIGINGDSCVIENCTASNNGGAGIGSNGGSIVKNCTTSRNAAQGISINSNGGRVIDCYSSNNASTGILINDGSVKD